jgi:hypothetical protein
MHTKSYRPFQFLAESYYKFLYGKVIKVVPVMLTHNNMKPRLEVEVDSTIPYSAIASRSASFTPGRKTWCPLDRKSGEAQNRSTGAGRRKNPSPFQESEDKISQLDEFGDFIWKGGARRRMETLLHELTQFLRALNRVRILRLLRDNFINSYFLFWQRIFVFFSKRLIWKQYNYRNLFISNLLWIKNQWIQKTHNYVFTKGSNYGVCSCLEKYLSMVKLILRG